MLVDNARCVLLQKRCGFAGGFNNIRLSLNIQSSGGIFQSKAPSSEILVLKQISGAPHQSKAPSSELK